MPSPRPGPALLLPLLLLSPLLLPHPTVAASDTDPDAAVQEGFFTLAVDQPACARNLTLRATANASAPHISLNGVSCTSSEAATFADLRKDPRLPAGEILSTVGVGALLTATLPADADCGAGGALPAGVGLVYVRIDTVAGALLKPGVLAFLANDAQLKPFIPALEAVDVGPGVLVASTRACAWRRQGDAALDGQQPSPSPTPSQQPTVSPSPSTPVGDSVDLAACFPARATVVLRDGTTVAMSDLRVGDHVRVAGDTFSPVVLWTHRDGRAQLHDFVRVALANGATLTVSPGHYVYVADTAAGATGPATKTTRLVPARWLRVGMAMLDATGQAVHISNIRRVTDTGLYNPQTAHGDVVVDGVRCSTYTTAVRPAAAHALLTPVRAAFCAARWLALGHSATRMQMTWEKM